jgi:hypothetical protein
MYFGKKKEKKIGPTRCKYHNWGNDHYNFELKKRNLVLVGHRENNITCTSGLVVEFDSGPI